jgi:imidazolonepropionase
MPALTGTTTLITNIGELTTHDPEHGRRHNVAMVVSDRVEWIGPVAQAPAADALLDAAGGAVLPGFVDSHSHLVFAGDRAAEFSARMSGQPYTGGGIRTTMAATRAASDEQLRANVARLAGEMLRQGTTTIEIKSGYGLSTPDEARSLRIAAEFSDEVTFLGAHVKPPDTDGYVSLVTGEMLAACAPLATWIDVFCERGAFDVDESRTVLRAGIAAGLLPRLHTNQLSTADQMGGGGGVRLAVELGCASADHCTHLSRAEIELLASVAHTPVSADRRSGPTVATLLPGAEFSTRSPYPPARALIDAGVPVALATDCNPGSSYTSSMPFCIALAVREMAMTPAEAIWSATAGGALALRRPELGRLGIGAPADLMVLDAPSAVHLAYRPGVPLVKHVMQAQHKGVQQ